MKKIIISFLAIFLLAPSVWAVSFTSEHSNSFSRWMTVEIAPMTITAEEDGEITAEHGINIILDPIKVILWNANEITATGSAVENGRVASTFTPEFQDDYKTLHIPVAGDWLAGESLVMTGLKLRSYHREVNNTFFILDIDGDKVQDERDNWGYKVTELERIDTTAPYPVTNVAYTLAEDKSYLRLTWDNPPDYDFAGVTIKRTLTRNGEVNPLQALANNSSLLYYIDNDIQDGDEIMYEIFTHDVYNTGEVVNLAVNIEPEGQEPEEPVEPEEPSEDPITDEHEVTQEERDSMNRLYTSYKVRNEIKCQRDDSACLWAKINLIYTQEILKLSDVETSLTDRELYLLGLRIKWPEQRFQDKCVEADTPDKTCTALGRSLKRAHYFLERSE